MVHCKNCQRNQTDYCYKCKHGYYGSKDEEQNKKYDLSEYYRPSDNIQHIVEPDLSEYE